MRENKQIEFEYTYQQPARYTYEQPQLRLWTERWCKGKVLNLFSGKTRLSVDEFRVDIDPETKPDHLGDAYEFVRDTKMKFDTVILDPPYNVRKAREKYEGRFIGKLKQVKDALPRILNVGARVIHSGYDTVGMGRNRNFKKIAVCLVCHGGDHNDTLNLVEEMANQLLHLPEKLYLQGLK